MPIAQSNGLRIAYETFGDPRDPPLLLIMGLGAQMIVWPEPLCEMLVGLGRQVIRFDNRDVGESSRVGSDSVGALVPKLQAAMAGLTFETPYTLDDMADDAVGLLDALGHEQADVVGASMGGMIAQTMAIHHSKRVRTLTSIMSTTGDRSLPPARPEVLQVVMQPVSPGRAAAIERALTMARTLAGPGYPFAEERVRDIAGRAFDRGASPAGVLRQLLAILASGSRRELLASVRIPTLVLHGADDPLVLLACGRDTAAAIPGARLVVYPGMGHDLPAPLWPEFAREIGSLIKG